MRNKNMEETAHKALKSIAKREGVSMESVRHEIKTAVAAARQNSNPAVQALWRAMLARDTDALTAESIVAHFARIEMDRED